VRTVEEVAEFLKIDPKAVIKTLFYEAEFTDKQEMVAVVLRGDRNLNEVKLLNRLGCLRVEMATEKRIPGGCRGFAGRFVGPIGLPGIRIIADAEIPLMVQGIVGANQNNFHYQGVNPGRDFPLDEVFDLRLVEAGEACPECGSPLRADAWYRGRSYFQTGDQIQLCDAGSLPG